MIETITSPLRAIWESLLERLFFLPPFPESIDSLALFSLLLVVGLLIGEWLHAHARWPKVIGYVLAGILFGPSALGWISIEALAQARPIADAALGLLMMEVGRRLDLSWLRRNPELLRSTLADITLSFALIFIFCPLAGRSDARLGRCHGRRDHGFGPGCRFADHRGSQGPGTGDRTHHPAYGDQFRRLLCRLRFVLGIVHAELSEDWLNAIVHPLWVVVGALLVGGIGTWLALRIAKTLPKGSLAQVFVLIACALLAVGIARMLAVPVFLTLFLMGVLLASRDRQQTLRYTELPEGHWLLAIVLFVIVGASLPWQDFTWLAGLQALGLLLVRAAAKAGAMAWSGGSLPLPKRLLVGMGIQPLSATAVFMAYEIASLYPEVGRSALTLPLFAAAMMELVGPALCRLALHRSGECESGERSQGGIA